MKQYDDLVPLNSAPAVPNVFSTEGMPKVILKYAENISEVYGVPIEMTCMPLLVACGSAVKKKIWLDSGKYRNYAQFYLIINAPSGTGKTEPLKRAFAPLKKIDRQNYAVYLDELKKWKALCKYNSSQKPKLPEPPKPFFKQLLVGNTTPEALTDLLYNNEGGGTVYVDELSGWFGNWGRYNKGSEAQTYLSYFDNTDEPINRKEQITLIVEPFVNIIGTIQPEVLTQTINSEAMQKNGLASRFLYVTCLDIVRQYKNDLVPEPAYVDEYEALINRLYNLKLGFEVKLTPEANQLYKDFGDYLTDCINPLPRNAGFLRSSLSKMEIHCLRLALVIHIAKISDLTGNEKDDISTETMQTAISLCHYFIKNIPIPNSFELVKIETNELKVVELLKDKGKSQTDIATEIGLSQGYVSRINRKYNIR